MQPLTSTMSIDKFNVISDIFSQAITGELIGMSNFASLSETVEDPFEKMEAVEHANSERMHAEGFLELAKRLELKAQINLDGQYWKGVREVFLTYAKKKDFIACLVIQEIMLESFAVSMYNDVGNSLEGEMGQLFLSISKEEQEHLNHASKILQSELLHQGSKFISKVEEIHYACMTILSEWTAVTDLKGHCGVCNGDCMKTSLHHVDLDIQSMRGHALSHYARALDNIGIPGEKSIIWIANLPI